jgi:hypothetical protein
MRSWRSWVKAALALRTRASPILVKASYVLIEILTDPECFVRGSPRTAEQCLPRSGRCDPEAG